MAREYKNYPQFGITLRGLEKARKDLEHAHQVLAEAQRQHNLSLIAVGLLPM